MNYTKTIRVLEDICKDMKQNAMYFDGENFNGETVARYLGYQGAAIAALANILKEFIERDEALNEQRISH